MTVAELFVKLGIKGADKTRSALENVGEGLENVKSMSLEAKAALVGAVYALERLMSGAAQQGLALKQFGDFTGLSTDRLQRWQYIARQTGTSADEMASSIKSVQAAMAKMAAGQGSPAGLGAVMGKVGLDPSRLRDTFYVMDKLREYAKATKDVPDLANQFLASFGLSEGAIRTMRESDLDLNKVSPDKLFSGNQIEQLAKISVAWENLWDKIQKGAGAFASLHGLKLVNEISKITDEVLKLIGAFTKLIEKLRVFELIGLAFKGWGQIFELINQNIGDAGKNTESGKKEPLDKLLQSKLDAGMDNILGFFENIRSGGVIGAQPAQPKGTGITQNNNAQINIYGVDKAADAQHELNKATMRAFRQLSAQGQGT